MASLDQAYTITFETTQAKADLAELNAQVDLVLAKLEYIKELSADCQIKCSAEFRLKGEELQAVFDAENTRRGFARTIGAPIDGFEKALKAASKDN